MQALADSLWRYGARVFDHGGLLLLATALLLVGLYFAARLRQLLPTKNRLWHDIPKLISHVPNETVTAWHHVRLGLLLVLGFGIVGALLWTSLSAGDMTANSYIATSVGVMIGLLALPFTLWTLYQTKRLERLQGEPIQRFDQLIKAMTTELRRLKLLYEENKDRSSSAFRLCLVTNNPFFGVITYPDKTESRDFRLAVEGIAACIRDHRNQRPERRKGQGIVMKVICANESRLAEFNARYFDASAAEELKAANIASEKFLTDLIGDVGEGAIVRIGTAVGEAQYAVIGDVVFEFLLESPHGPGAKTRGSDIASTTRIEDKAAADRFERFTVFLEALAGEQCKGH